MKKLVIALLIAVAITGVGFVTNLLTSATSSAACVQFADLPYCWQSGC